MNPLLAAVLAMPMTHRVLVTYADGSARHFDTRSLASANNHAIGERRKIGKKLISRSTGEPVMVVSVDVVAI